MARIGKFKPANPFADPEAKLVAVPPAPEELEKYKPRLTKPTAPELPSGPGKRRQVQVLREESKIDPEEAFDDEAPRRRR